MLGHGNSVLLIDDREAPGETLADYLRQEGYEVKVAGSVVQALEVLNHVENPTFIFADRNLPDGEIEKSGLAKLNLKSPHSLIVVFTREAELSPLEKHSIRAAGAVRILDRKAVMAETVEDIKRITTEFRELLELSSALKRAVRERDHLVSALVGSDVGITIIDQEHYVWFVNEAQARIVGRLCSGGLCWNLFHGHPPAAGQCWGCGVAEVFASGRTVERLYLSRMQDGHTAWLTVQCTPIYREGNVSDNPKDILAVREAVSTHVRGLVSSMSRENKLMAIARGLLQAGFGRVRIYEAEEETGKKKPLAAASQADDPQDVIGHYWEKVQNLTFDFRECPYSREAVEKKVGLLVKEWDARGISPFAGPLELEPPYFTVPVFSFAGDKLLGFLAADFGDIDCSKKDRDALINHLAHDATLQWLGESFGAEIRRALLGSESESEEILRRYKAVQKARLSVGGAATVPEATQALADAFHEVLPDGCVVSVRRLEKDMLIEEEAFRKADVIAPEKAISIDDKESLAAYIVRGQGQTLWLDDYVGFKQKALENGTPGGLSPESTLSVAHVPLQFEGTIYGTLSIDSAHHILWKEEGLVAPILSLRPLTSLVLREISVHENLDEAKGRERALGAFAATATRDAIWRHWAIQQLQSLSALASSILTWGKKVREPLSDDERKRAGDRLREIGHHIDDAADLLKTGYPRPEEATEPNSDLAAVLASLESVYSGRGVVFEVAKDRLVVAIPRLYLRRILSFLIDNALEAAEVGSRPEVSVVCQRSGDTIRIEVTDEGRGIPLEVRDSILKRPVPSSKGGEGVGLLIARGTAIQYGGDLVIKSYERPTQVCLSFPASLDTRG